MRIALCYDLQPSGGLSKQQPPDYYAEFDSEETIAALEQALQSLGHVVLRIGNLAKLAERLYCNATPPDWDRVFSIAEGLHGRAREAHIPALLEAHNLPYVGSDALSLALSLDKALSKRLWREAGLPTADFAVISAEEMLAGALDRLELPLPWFAKPLHEGSSKGIDAGAKLNDLPQARRYCQYLLDSYQQPVLLEPFLPGREFTVALLGTGAQARALGGLELCSTLPDGYSSFQEKESWERRQVQRFQPLPAGALGQELQDIALQAYRSLQCRDMGRIDLRLDVSGAVQLLELNALPGLHPSHSAFANIAKNAGLSYPQLFEAILQSAAARL